MKWRSTLVMLRVHCVLQYSHIGVNTPVVAGLVIHTVCLESFHRTSGAAMWLNQGTLFNLWVDAINYTSGRWNKNHMIKLIECSNIIIHNLHIIVTTAPVTVLPQSCISHGITAVGIFPHCSHWCKLPKVIL